MDYKPAENKQRAPLKGALYLYTFFNNYKNIRACGALQLRESPHAHAHACKHARARTRVLSNFSTDYINTRQKKFLQKYKSATITGTRHY